MGIATVDEIVTQYPTEIGTLTVTNPQLGTPSPGAQTIEDYRAQVVQAGRASATGMTAYLRTALQAVPGVQSRLVSIRQTSGGWEVIVGGGDPYAIAGAIFTSMFDLSILSGSVMAVAGITNANPGVVTTTMNHGLTTGETAEITGIVGMTGINGVPLTVTVLNETSFSIGINTSASGTYQSGGVVTPNSRNMSVNITQYPDIYTIPFVIPPQQTLEIVLLWNTNATNLISPAAVAAVGQPAIVSYINSIPVGAPINLFELQAAFQAAVAPIIPARRADPHGFFGLHQRHRRHAVHRHRHHRGRPGELFLHHGGASQHQPGLTQHERHRHAAPHDDDPVLPLSRVQR